jgi:LysM domain
MVSYIFRVVQIVVLASISMRLIADGMPATNTVHQVTIGDTLKSIALKYTGSENNIGLIRELNPHLAEVGLQIGDVLYVPDANPSSNRKPPKAITQLPPTPLVKNTEVKLIPGFKYGLAQVFQNGKFMLVPTPVDRE